MVMGIFLSGSVGFGATLSVDGTVTAGDYDIAVTDVDIGGEQFALSASDIDTLHWGLVPDVTYHPVTNPLAAWYTIGMTVKGPVGSPQINTTGDGTGSFAPTKVHLSLSQGGTERNSLDAFMFFGGFLVPPLMWDTSAATPAAITLDATNLKYAVGTGLEIAIRADKFNLDPAQPFSFDLHFEGGGENEDDRIQDRIPEPATMSMLLVGGLIPLVRRRRRKK
jgi:hypothetical protein